MTRLSAQPAGQFGSTPAGIPVPAISVSCPTRSASFTPSMELAEKSMGPRPHDHTMLPFLSASITRLLNWSEIRMLPGWLNFEDETIPAQAGSAANAIAPEIKAPAARRRIFMNLLPIVAGERTQFPRGAPPVGSSRTHDRSVLFPGPNDSIGYVQAVRIEQSMHQMTGSRWSPHALTTMIQRGFGNAKQMFRRTTAGNQALYSTGWTASEW